MEQVVIAKSYKMITEWLCGLYSLSYFLEEK